MECTLCGENMEMVVTDLPFKLTQKSIVIIKEVPVFQCKSCVEYLFEDHVMDKIDKILGNIDNNTELQIRRFVA